MAWEFFKALLSKPEKPDAEQQRAMWKDASAIEAKVKEIVASELSKDMSAVTLETNSYDEGDSVGNIEIVMLCEETFGIEIPDEAAEHLATVGQIVDYVQQQLGIKPD